MWKADITQVEHDHIKKHSVGTAELWDLLRDLLQIIQDTCTTHSALVKEIHIYKEA